MRDGGAVRVLGYYLQRLQLTLQVVETMELVARTSELARVFGIDFFSVLNRGSQYRVESMLSRLGRTDESRPMWRHLLRERLHFAPTRATKGRNAQERRVRARVT